MAKRLAGRFLLGAALVSYGALGYYNMQANKKSTLFIGEPREFDNEFNKKKGIPATEIMKTLGEFSFSLVLYKPICDLIFPKKVPMELVIEKHRIKFEELTKKYPKSFIGYVGLAWIEKSLNNLSKGHAYLMKAYEIAEANPDWTEPLKILLPLDPNYFFQKTYKFPTVWKEVATNSLSNFHLFAENVWAISAPYQHGSELLGPTLVQSSLIRLNDGKSLILVNPTGFTEETISKINSLGEVKAIITPTQPHGAALEKCYSNWPDAEIYGTSPSTKHDQPLVPWTGFLTSEGILKHQLPPAKGFFSIFQKSEALKKEIIKPVWGDELSYQPLEGHVFEEVVLYHKPSKSAVGFTDMVIFTDHQGSEMKEAPWLFMNYFFALGLDSGKKQKQVASQSYHIIGTTDESKLKKCLEKVLDNDIEHLVFGHGGIIDGKERCRDAILDGFEFAFNSPPISRLERMLLACRWAEQFNPFYTFYLAFQYNFGKPTATSGGSAYKQFRDDTVYDKNNFVTTKFKKE